MITVLNAFWSTSVRFNFISLDVKLVMGSELCEHLLRCDGSLLNINFQKPLRVFGAVILLIVSILFLRGLAPLSITHNPTYG